MSPVFPIYDRGEPPEERPGDGGQGSSQEDFQGEPNKTNQLDQEQDHQEKGHPDDTNKTTKTSNTKNQTTKRVTMSKHNLPIGEAMSRWEKLSPEERDKKKSMETQARNPRIL